jgi:glycosyltransferase involved in cell wall biosynthesis
MTDPTFSIIVPTIGRPDALHETLTGLLALDYPADRYELVVVDDGADEITARVVDRIADRDISVKLVGQYRRGAASARNHGARIASGEWLLFCDDDFLVPQDHVIKHRAAHQRHGDAVVGGTWELAPVVADALRTTPFGRYRLELVRRYSEPSHGRPLDGDLHRLRVPLLSAANLSLRRDLFWQIGGFDEQFPLAGAEDQDLSIRARAADAVLVLDTEIRCLHNDRNLGRRAYCEREERNASTMPFLVRKHPAEVGDIPYARENRPIEADDPPSLVSKKLLKRLLATRPMLDALHGLAGAGEAIGAPERFLRRLYSLLLGLHLFRGFRSTWRR